MLSCSIRDENVFLPFVLLILLFILTLQYNVERKNNPPLILSQNPSSIKARITKNTENVENFSFHF